MDYSSVAEFLTNNPERRTIRRTRVPCVMDVVKGNAGHPNRLITFDTETRPLTCADYVGDRPEECGACVRSKGLMYEDADEIQDLTMVCATFSDVKRGQLERQFFTDTDSFWDWVDDCTVAKMVTWLVAHNLGFDLMVLKFNTMLVTRGWTARTLVLPDPSGPTMMEWVNDGRVLKMVNLANWWGMRSLSSIGKTLGTYKGEVDPTEPRYRHAAPDSAEYQTMVDYCHQDAYIVREAVIAWAAFCRDNDLGTFAMTQAGQSLAAFRHRFMTHDIYLHTNQAVTDLERRAYKGARTECFRRGVFTAPTSRPFRYVDVNSLYPAMMHRHRYPTRMTGHLTYTDDAGITDLKTLLCDDEVCVVARVSVDIRTEHQRIVAHRSAHGRLLYPTGTFNETLTTRELSTAMERGLITRVHDIVTYESAPIFAEYVDYFYRLRQRFKAEGNVIFTEIVKIFLNSLYGKFGQHVREWEPCDILGLEEGTTTVMDAETGEVQTYRNIGGIIEQRAQEYTESRYSFAAIAAHTTADARMEITGHYETAGYGEVYYCDTDSLFVSDTGYRNLGQSGVLDNTRLGALKLEDTATEIRVTTLKDYTFGVHTKRKGMRRDALTDHHGGYRQTQFRGLAGAMRAHDPNHARVGAAHKTFTGAYTKGTEGPAGHVIPIHLTE